MLPGTAVAEYDVRRQSDDVLVVGVGVSSGDCDGPVAPSVHDLLGIVAVQIRPDYVLESPDRADRLGHRGCQGHYPQRFAGGCRRPIAGVIIVAESGAVRSGHGGVRPGGTGEAQQAVIRGIDLLRFRNHPLTAVTGDVHPPGDVLQVGLPVYRADGAVLAEHHLVSGDGAGGSEGVVTVHPLLELHLDPGHVPVSEVYHHPLYGIVLGGRGAYEAHARYHDDDDGRGYDQLRTDGVHVITVRRGSPRGSGDRCTSPPSRWSSELVRSTCTWRCRTSRMPTG